MSRDSNIYRGYAFVVTRTSRLGTASTALVESIDARRRRRLFYIRFESSSFLQKEIKEKNKERLGIIFLYTADSFATRSRGMRAQQHVAFNKWAIAMITL